MIDAPREDRERVSLGIAERAGMCALEPAPGGRLEVTFTDAPDIGRVAAICKVARDRGWRAYRAVEGVRLGIGRVPAPRAARPLRRYSRGRTVGAVLRRVRSRDDRPAGPGLVDPSGTPRGAKAAAPADPVDAPLLDALKEWRMRASDGKPAYTVAHNSTLESIAALKPSTLDELATMKGVGPTFVERHGEQVLALLARSAA